MTHDRDAKSNIFLKDALTAQKNRDKHFRSPPGDEEVVSDKDKNASSHFERLAPREVRLAELSPQMQANIRQLGNTDPFKMLGIEQNATNEEIKSARSDFNPNQADPRDRKMADEKATKLEICRNVLLDEKAKQYCIQQITQTTPDAAPRRGR